MILGFVILYLLLSIGIGLAACQAGPYHEGFRGRRSESSAADCDGDGLCDVVRRRSGARDFCHVRERRIAWCCCRSIRVEHVSDSRRTLLRPPRLYRLSLLIVGDYYRVRYDCSIEVLCTLCVVASYLGWVAAQFKVRGLVLNVVTDGGVSQSVGIVIGAAIVLTYTTFGGMFFVAILDFVQISVIMGGGCSISRLS